MPEVLSVGGLLIPILRVSLLLSLMAAGWFVGRFATRLELDSAWPSRVAETSVWVGLLGARLGFVGANWSAYRDAPWTILYLWQGGFTPLVGLLAGAGYVVWRLRQRPLPERNRQLQALLSGFGVAASLFGVVYASTLVDLDSSLLRVGDTMPNFTLSDLSGDPVNFSSLEGQVVVLNFWATWCPPCRREMPLLDDIQTEYGPEGLTIVGVDLEEPLGSVKAYVEGVGVQYPIWLDGPLQNAPDTLQPDGIYSTRELFSKIGGVGLPTTVFIGRDGVIQSSQVGELSRGVLQNRVEALLARPR